MSISNLIGERLAIEAIAFQQNNSLFSELTECVGKLREQVRGNDKALAALKDLSKIVVTRTNIGIDFYLTSGYDFHSQPPMLTNNHPLVEDFWRTSGLANVDGLNVDKFNFDKVGHIDRKTSKVFGLYSKFLFSSGIGTTALKGDLLTDKEIAAVILHEVGHIFTYLEYLGTTVVKNYALAAVADAAFQNDQSDKVKLIKQVKHKFDLKGLDDELSQNTKTPEELLIVFIDSDVKRMRSELGCSLYDKTGWEYLSDQFSIRHSLSVDLLTAIDKLNRHHDSSVGYGSILFFTIEAAKLLRFILINAFTSGFWGLFTIIAGLLINPAESTYDKPKDRLIRARQQLVEYLKLKDITSERRKQVIDDLTVLDEIIAGTSGRETLFAFIFSRITPSRIKALNEKELQKQLEYLAMNDLFVASAKFKTMS